MKWIHPCLPTEMKYKCQGAQGKQVLRQEHVSLTLHTDHATNGRTNIKTNEQSETRRGLLSKTNTQQESF